MHETNHDDPVAELANPARLAAALALALDGSARRLAYVGVRCGDRSATASVGDDPFARGDEPAAAMPVGCLAKVLTATLAARMLGNARIGVDAHIVDLLHVGERHSALERVTVRHLLEHTHGLDGSLIEQPALREGLIDASDLARRATTEPPLAPPGAVYSYGSTGPWLVAAVLERLAARPYPDLLRDELLAPLGIRTDPTSLHTCAATGGALSLTISHWLRLLRYAAVQCAWPPDTGPACTITALPGWNPLERGVHLGWKYHGCGWFGHQSVWPGSSALVRIHPRRCIELAVLSRDHAASVIAGRLFGGALPELFDFRVPAALAPGALRDFGHCAGSYASAALQAELEMRGDAPELCVLDRIRGSRVRVALSAAAAHTFFPRPSAIDGFPYVQVVPADGGASHYLWNGRFVLRRR